MCTAGNIRDRGLEPFGKGLSTARFISIGYAQMRCLRLEPPLYSPIKGIMYLKIADPGGGAEPHTLPFS